MARLRASRSFLTLVGVLAACGRDTASRPRETAIAVADDWGRAVSLPAPARRIVSLAPATTELVFALGLGDRLVGRTRWCAWPAAATRVPDVGNGIGPSVEVVAARRPDLVLLYASEANRAALARFEALDIPVAVVRLDRSSDLRRTAHLIGQLAADGGAAAALVRSFDASLAAAATPSDRAETRRPRVYVDVESNPPLTLGRGSYLSEIIRAAGGENVFGDLPQASAPVTLEAIVARDPDVILMIASDTNRAVALARRPGWRAVRAVREDRVLVVSGDLYGRPSPRMPEAVQDLRERLARLARR